MQARKTEQRHIARSTSFKATPLSNARASPMRSLRGVVRAPAQREETRNSRSRTAASSADAGTLTSQAFAPRRSTRSSQFGIIKAIASRETTRGPTNCSTSRVRSSRLKRLFCPSGPALSSTSPAPTTIPESRTGPPQR